jgi:hypothetical protein
MIHPSKTVTRLSSLINPAPPTTALETYRSDPTPRTPAAAFLRFPARSKGSMLRDIPEDRG